MASELRCRVLHTLKLKPLAPTASRDSVAEMKSRHASLLPDVLFLTIAVIAVVILIAT